MKKWIPLFALLCFSFVKSHASHIVGGEVSYKATSTTGIFEVHLVLYRNCDGGVALCSTTCGVACTQTMNIDGADASCASSSFGSFTLNLVNVRDIQTGAPSIKNTCNNMTCVAPGTFTPGIERYEFIGFANIGPTSGIPTSCCNVRLNWNLCCRNGQIATGSANQNFYIDAVINRCLSISPANSSPLYVNDPIMAMCGGENFTNNLGGFDPDGDSLTYAFAPSLQLYNSPVSYTAPWSAQTPMPWSGSSTATAPGGIHCDPITGMIDFTPGNAGGANFYGVTCVEIKQWKTISGVPTVIGITRRDFQQVVLANCPVNNIPRMVSYPPDTGTVGNMRPKLSWSFPPGIQTCFTVVAKDTDYFPPTLVDTAIIDTFHLNNSFANLGATFTRLSNPGALRDSMRFCWTPTTAQQSYQPYILSVRARDSRKPKDGISSYAIKIYVSVSPKITSVTDSAMLCLTKRFRYQLATGSPAVSQSNWSVRKLTGTTTTLVDSIINRSYLDYTFADSGTFLVNAYAIGDVNLGSPAGVGTDTVYIAKGGVKVIGTDTSLCKNNTALLSSVVSGGKAPYTVKWYENTTMTTGLTKLVSVTTASKMLAVTVTDSSNCTYTDSVKVTVFPFPTLGIGNYTLVDQCENNNSFIFTNTSWDNSISGLNYTWRLDDTISLTLDSAQRIRFALANPGAHNLKLYSVTPNGCRDTLTRIVSLYSKPHAAFTVNDSTQCRIGNSFVFTNTTTNVYGSVNYTWKNGTTTATTTNYAKSFGTVGMQVVKLIATDSLLTSCSDSISQNVYVYPQSTVTNTINNTTQCFKGNSFVFTNTTIPDSSLSYLWTIDGDTSSATIVTKSFTSVGVKNVKLNMISPYGCSDSLVKTVIVAATPTAKFTTNDSIACIKGNSFVFTNQSSVIPSGSLGYSWSMGDGSATLTTLNPTYTYTKAGTFTSRLITSNGLASQCRDTFTKTITIYPQPTMSYSINNATQCLKGNSFVFTNTSTSDSSYNYKWIIDGDTSTSTIATKSFTVLGTKNVKLKMVTNLGCNDSLLKTVSVLATPVAKFATSDSILCLKGNSVVFSNQSSITPLGSLTYNWNMGNGAPIVTSIDAIYSYPAAGNYTSRLIVTNGVATQCKDTFTKTITIYPQPSLAGTVNNTSQCLTGNKFTFTNTSTGLTDPNYQFVWNVLGVNKTGTIITESFATAGNKTVKLMASTNKGCIDSAAFTVTVNAAPVAMITVNDSSQCLKRNSFVFTNTSSGATSGSFVIDGAAATSNTTVTKTFTTIGTKMARLVALSAAGCRDTVYKQVEVKYSPTAKFTISDTTVCKREIFVLANTSSNTVPVKSSWIYSDNTVDSASNTSKYFTTSGNQKVYLGIITDKGCGDTVSRNVLVYASPAAPIVSGPTSIAPDTVVTYSVTATPATHYSWAINNGVFLSSTNMDTNSVDVIWDSTFARGYIYVSTKTGTGCWSDTAQYDISILGSVGLPSVDATFHSLSVYPNPATDAVTVSLNSIQSQIIKVAIYNIVGTEVKRNTFNCSKGMLTEQINLHELQKGIYLMRIEGEEGQQTVKILVK